MQIRGKFLILQNLQVIPNPAFFPIETRELN
jgi:hypothetical protein